MQYLHDLPAIDLGIAACIKRIKRRNKPELNGLSSFSRLANNPYNGG